MNRSMPFEGCVVDTVDNTLSALKVCQHTHYDLVIKEGLAT